MNRKDLRELLKDLRIQAFLRAIRLGEGTSDARGYTRLVGGGNFTGFADHPNRLIEVQPGLKSTAAGAYQFLFRTWLALSTQYHFEDFSPDCQDEGAVALIVEKAAQRHILADRIEDAVKACAGVWASLPGSPHGQPTVTMEAFLAEYRKWLGVNHSQVGVNYSHPPPIISPPEPKVSDTVTNTAIAAVTIANPVVGAALSVFRSLWPELKPLFTAGGSEVAQRNQKAAEAVVNAVMEATGSPTPAAAIDAVQADPVMAQQARTAAVGMLDQMGLIDVSGVSEARKWNIAASEFPSPWRQPVVWFAASLVPLIYMTTWIVINNDSKFGSDTRAFVVGAVMGTLLGGMVAYFMGTSAGSQRKTDIIAAK